MVLLPNPYRLLLIAAACLVNLLIASYATPSSAVAQSVAGGSRYMVEVPVDQLNQIQDELRYLRTRDAQRQAWERSVVNRFPSTGVVLASGSYEDASVIKPALASVGVHKRPHCVRKSCCCNCYPCECPLPEAPCIECPRVSTLSPYFNVSVFGAFKLDMLLNSQRPVSTGTPFFLGPESPFGLDQNTVSIHARQSTLGAAFTGPQMGDLKAGGTLIVMFFNDSVLLDQYGLLPLQAWGELKNEDWRFAAGLQFDVFSPGLPTVLPFSSLAATGNSGNSFRGQIRLERFVHVADDLQWTLQFAISEPISSTVDPTFRLSEDNGWPNIEGRIALGLGSLEPAGLAAKRPLEIGVSGVLGQIRTTPPSGDRVVADVWGLSVDFRLKINEFFGFMGEVYTGQTLGTYNGGILQNVNIDTLEGIRSSGGWLELFTYWTPCLHSHFGYGIDDPIDGDVALSAAALGRIRNSVVYANLLWDLNRVFRVGLEFTWRETDYKNPFLPDADGAGLHTQFQWMF